MSEIDQMSGSDITRLKVICDDKGATVMFSDTVDKQNRKLQLIDILIGFFAVDSYKNDSTVMILFGKLNKLYFLAKIIFTVKSCDDIAVCI